MSYIVRYQKFIDADRTVEIRLPEGEGTERIGSELATIGEVTYVSLPDGAVLPQQPVEITVEPVTLTTDLREQICAASPLVRLINTNVVAMIRERYTVDDEIKLLRTAPSEEFDVYNEYVEACRAWGRDQRMALGL